MIVDITHVLRNQYHHLVIDVGDKTIYKTIYPRIIASTTSFYNYFTNKMVHTVYLTASFINPCSKNKNNEIAEFKIQTQMEFDQGLTNLFTTKTGSFKMHPLHLLFFQGAVDSTIVSCPSMSIHVDEEYQKHGLARFLIQMAIYALEKIIDDGILEKYFGLPLNEQILAIDADASAGFWDKIGMTTHRSGYDYNGVIPRRGLGMEKIITFSALRKWAYSK